MSTETLEITSRVFWTPLADTTKNINYIDMKNDEGALGPWVLFWVLMSVLLLVLISVLLWL